MATPKTGKPRGRPPGTSRPKPQRDAFLHELVADIMEAHGLHLDDATHVADYLLSDDLNRAPRWLVTPGAIIRGNRYSPRQRLASVMVPTEDTKALADGLVTRDDWKNAALEYEPYRIKKPEQMLKSWWGDWNARYHRQRGVPEGVRDLRKGGIRAAYLRVQAAKAESYTCDNCGHVNESMPARGEYIDMTGDCRKCGRTIQDQWLRCTSSPN